MHASAMAGVALLSSPRSFAVNNSDFFGEARKTLVMPRRLVPYRTTTAILRISALAIASMFHRVLLPNHLQQAAVDDMASSKEVSRRRQKDWQRERRLAIMGPALWLNYGEKIPQNFCGTTAALTRAVQRRNRSGAGPGGPLRAHCENGKLALSGPTTGNVVYASLETRQILERAISTRPG